MVLSFLCKDLQVELVIRSLFYCNPPLIFPNAGEIRLKAYLYFSSPFGNSISGKDIRLNIRSKLGARRAFFFEDEFRQLLD